MPPKSFSNPKFGLSQNLRIGVLLGGRSSERKISLRSGRAVHQALLRAGFHTLRIDPADPQKMRRVLGRIDLAFLALHGHGGEDGIIQQRLERQGIPYVGSDAAGSRQAFDKKTAKNLFRRKGIPTPDFVVIRPADWKHKLENFPTPFFVKPVRNGSSIGVFPVEDLRESAETLRQALREYGELLVERRIVGREFTVGVLGKKALPVVELVPKGNFYDYRSKYTQGMTEYRVPAPISRKLARRLQRMALAVHRALGLRDMSRVDIMMDRKGHPYVLEANSIPGFTELSLLPKAARAEGISFDELCSQLVFWAWQRRPGPLKNHRVSSNGKKET